MKITDSEYSTFCKVLENRSYRYSDVKDNYSDDYKLFDNIQKRVLNSEQDKSLRFTLIQKTYLITMFEDFLTNNLRNHPNKTDSDNATNILQKLRKGL
jgi:hypothetical protein